MRLVTMASIVALIAAPAAGADRQVERTVTRHVRSIVPPDGGGGVAVALRIEGQTLFFNYGWADRANKRPITSDTLFNLASLRKVFETTLLAQAVGNGELRLDDPAAKYVAELDRDRDIGRVTLGQLATHTSGLLLPQDHPPWPDWGYTLPEFIRTLNAWEADKAPGQQHLYPHAGYVLLQLALERRYSVPIDELIEQRLLRPLGMTSTALPRQDDSARGRLSPEYKRRAVQGYSDSGEPLREPGSQESYYHWPGTGRVYCSARGVAVFLAADLGGGAVAARGDELAAPGRRDHRPAQPAGVSLGGPRRGRADHHQKVRRPPQRIRLYRDDATPKARHRDPRQSRQSVSQRSRPPHPARARSGPTASSPTPA